jgi:3-phosphoshikimate 1-carboxyvinyltransferase
MLRWIGLSTSRREIQNDDCLEAICIEGGTRFEAKSGTVPGDISTAAFFIAAAVLLPGSDLKINHVGLNPTRTRMLTVLDALGADLHLEPMNASDGSAGQDFDEPFGDVRVASGLESTGAEPANVLCGEVISQVIDELPILAVLGSQMMGGISIRDAAELRFKESDRIRATVENLRAMGAHVEEHEDGLTIPERMPLQGARINSHNDHRIAMAFTIAALVAKGESEIVGAECVGVSFPQFFEALESVVVR